MRKSNLLLLISLISTFTSFSQAGDFICATEDLNTNNGQTEYSCSTDPAVYENGDPLVLNIFFWQVLGPNGDYGGLEFTEDKLLESVALLNIEYNKYNIFFKYRGYDSFETPANLPKVERVWDAVLQRWVCQTVVGEVDPNGYGHIHRCQINPFFSYAFNDYRHIDALNIYVPYGTGFGGAARSLGSNMTILRLGALNQTTAYHEIAHNLGLNHTRTENGEEHVTRDVNDYDNFNACTVGDKVLDTAANSGYLHFDVNGDPYYPFINETNCTYREGTETDEHGEPYEISHEDVINTMSNAYNCIQRSFTPGQVIYMRETIVDNFYVTPALTDVASLYEPYQGEYYLGGPALPEASKPLFQPGFDYSFIECRCSTNDNSNCSQPTAYDDVSFQNLHTLISGFSKYDPQYNDMTHPNHTAILIDQLDTGQTRKCYDNFSDAPIGGSVIKFNDDVFNANVTITSKDSTAINNPNLINNLQDGLYKIEKNYNDGATQETVIIKENE